MARLPSERYLMQEIGGAAVLFENYTECEIVRFDPSDDKAAYAALAVIVESELGDEDRCYACFWAGYFRGNAVLDFHAPREPYIVCSRGLVVVAAVPAGVEIARFDPADGNAAARAQKSIYDSPLLSAVEKSRAYFWSGCAYAHACAQPDVAESPPPRRPYYVNLGVTDDQVARGDDYGRYDFPNLGMGGLGPDRDDYREW
jgi:hypothetical protein